MSNYIIINIETGLFRLNLEVMSICQTCTWIIHYKDNCIITSI